MSENPLGRPNNHFPYFLQTFMTTDLVSVIMPTRNRVGYIPDAIASVFGQTYYQPHSPNIELIIIADNCSDNTAEVVQIFQDKYPEQIIYLATDENIGGAKARNIGLDQAHGEYIAFLDDDDVWMQDKLHQQIPLLKSGEYSIVSCRSIHINASHKHHTHPQETIGIKDLWYENCLQGFSMCVSRKSYIGNSRINEGLCALQDWDLYLKIMQNSGLGAFRMGNCLVYYHNCRNRIYGNYQNLIIGQQLFLELWRHLHDSIAEYHQMRIACYKQKERNRGKFNFFGYLAACYRIARIKLKHRDTFNARYYLSIPFFYKYSVRGIKRVCKYHATIAKYRFYNRQNGLNTTPRNTPELIVSLTSYPARFANVMLVVESLLEQNLRPDKIILYLAKDEVGDKPLPDNFAKLQKRGLQIEIVDENTKSFKKLIPAYNSYPDSIIVTCDDDYLYPRWFLQNLYDSYLRHPDCISHYQSRQIKYIDKLLLPYQCWQYAHNTTPRYDLLPIGGTGILYPPHCLNQKIHDKIFSELCPHADDIWFKAMSLLNNTKTVSVSNKFCIFMSLPTKQSLYSINKTKNDRQIQNVFKHFNLCVPPD